MLNLLDQVEQNLTISKIGIEEFCESDDYCNKPLYPGQKVLLKLIFLEELDGDEEDILNFWIEGGTNGSEILISPNIRERTEYLREAGFNHFREVDLVGGRRSSKGFCTGMTLGKVMWDTLQLQDPGRHYGIDPDKVIYFSCVAGSEAQAKEFQYADFVSTVESCKAFEPYLVRSLETEFKVATSEDLRRISNNKKLGGRDRDIAKLRGKALAANAGTLRGSTTMALVIDEMAHMVPGESKASADQVYTAANPSLDQFGRDGILFCNSSPYSKVGMFFERFQEAMKMYDTSFEPSEPISPEIRNGNPLVFTLQYPSWAMFAQYKKYKSKWQPQHKFDKVPSANPDWVPSEKDEDGNYVYGPEIRAQILVARAEESGNPEKFKVERRGKFAEVTDAYLNPEMVDRVFRGIPTGFEEDMNGNKRVVLKPYRMNWGQDAINLFKYKAHLDPSSTTAGFGFGLGHTERFENENGFSEEHVVFDIIKRWNPKDFPGDTIKWKVVIDEVMTYLKLFRPYEVTFDQFQSAEPIQDIQMQLQDLGIGDVRVYVKGTTNEENWFRAESAKTAINHGFVHAPVDCTYIEPYGPDEEMKFLQKKSTGAKYPRVDKQDIGPVQTKDMADCVFEVVDALIGNIIAQQMRQRAVDAVMVPGAPGGYNIGGHQAPRLAELHPNLSGYYGATSRTGEQRTPPGFQMPTRGRLGGATRGMNRNRLRGRW